MTVDRIQRERYVLQQILETLTGAMVDDDEDDKTDRRAEGLYGGGGGTRQSPRGGSIAGLASAVSAVPGPFSSFRGTFRPSNHHLDAPFDLLRFLYGQATLL